VCVPTLSASGEALLASDRIAHLVTIEPDGSPQISCVWVELDDAGDIVFASLDQRRKLDNIRRDPRVSLSIEQGDLNQYGLAQYMVVHGRATITEGGGPALLQHLAHTYLGPDVVFPNMDDPPEGYIVHIAIERVGGIGDWTAATS